MRIRPFMEMMILMVHGLYGMKSSCSSIASEWRSLKSLLLLLSLRLLRIIRMHYLNVIRMYFLKELIRYMNVSVIQITPCVSSLQQLLVSLGLRIRFLYWRPIMPVWTNIRSMWRISVLTRFQSYFMLPVCRSWKVGTQKWLWSKSILCLRCWAYLGMTVLI